jgi:murein DD-endopeptidase MepM/ murein hydrolase activator NlpD
MVLARGDATAIASLAQRLGVDPRGLGALFELESGTDPNIWGGAGGQYLGLIQFGPGARKEVGLPQGPMTIAGQLPYVEKYFKQRGFQRGKHGLTELYRTVLVGNPGQSGTDSFGTNSDTAAKRMLPGGDLYKQFSKKFDPVFGGSPEPSPAPALLTQESDSLGLSPSGSAGPRERRSGDPLAAVAAALVQGSLEAAQAQPREPGRMAALGASPGLEAQVAAVTALLPGAAPVARAVDTASPQPVPPAADSAGVQSPVALDGRNISSIVKETAGGQPGFDLFFEDKRFPALLPGRVKEIGRENGYGNYVVVESRDPKTGDPLDVLYGHLADGSIEVGNGQYVRPGQQLATQGGTGNVRSADGTIASVDFLAPAPRGSGSMAPYKRWSALVDEITSSIRGRG